MRRWGIVLSVFYAACVLGVLIPGAMLLSSESQYGVSGFLKDLGEVYRESMVWVFTSMVVVSQALLLFL